MNKKYKEIKLNVDYEPYYGINVNIWGVESSGDDRATFIQKMFTALKDEWVSSNVDIADWLDFINTLNNGLNGDELFENVVKNCLYIEELERKAYDIGISLNCIRKNRHPYSESEEISIYEKLTPLLKKEKDFKEWFLDTLHRNDEKIYCILFNDSQSKEALINKIKNDIETKEKSKKYYEENIKRINEEIDKHKKELADLESKGE